MKTLAFILLSLVSFSSFADINCVGVLRSTKNSEYSITELVKVTTSKKQEEYLGMSNGYSFYAKHSLIKKTVYLDIINPEGELIAQTTSRALPSLFIQDKKWKVDLGCDFVE